MVQEENNKEQTLEGLTENIRKKIEGAKNTESYFSTACIYRVPEELRKLKESAYTPRLIAIGPLHRDDKHLKTPMQDVKVRYADYLLRRLTDVHHVTQVQKFVEVQRPGSLEECVAEMRKYIKAAEECYAEKFTVDVEMMLVDGCFILELFYRFYLKVRHGLRSSHKEATNGGDHDGSSNVSKHGASTSTPTTPLLQGAHTLASEPPVAPASLVIVPTGALGSSSAIPKPDPIFDSSLTSITIQHDLLLLENQIPFLVLERLFSLTVARICNNKISLTDLVDLYFCNIMSPEGEEEKFNHILYSATATTSSCGLPSDCVVPILGNKTTNGKEEEKKYHHILHKVHEYYLLAEKKEKYKRKGKDIIKVDEPKKYHHIVHKFMPPASELDFAGIKFVKGKDIIKVDEPEKGLFWWCHLASFKIPTLGIYDTTEPFLRNLIAFEQCVPRVSHHFTSYAFLMDMLVNSEKDIEVLVKAGVLRNYLGGSKDATDLFNNLCKEVVLGEFFFAETCKKATEYSGRFWPKNMAYVKRTYFASPWTFVAFCVGFIAFVISVTSFVLSLL